MRVPQMINPYLTPSAQPNRIPVVPPPPLHPSIPQAPSMMVPQMPQQMPMSVQPMGTMQGMQEYTPYPGETVPQRVAKNIALGMLSAFFSILGNQMSRVFQLWRWPPPNQ